MTVVKGVVLIKYQYLMSEVINIDLKSKCVQEFKLFMHNTLLLGRRLITNPAILTTKNNTITFDAVFDRHIENPTTMNNI